ncbi:response regulator [Candidatus Pelagadaptatus aseana]|uniref:response regulator n=1 Tax=Candidatus Pelagadaptatus aseana TaxID=3120508 RepID=UPI003C6FD216
MENNNDNQSSVEELQARLDKLQQLYEANLLELREARQQTIAANQTRAEFLTRMSHEIRTPMNAIIGMGHLLKDTSLNRKQKDYLNNINISAENLLQIIDEVLDFSKLESGKYLLENNHFDLDCVFEQLSSDFEERANDKNIELIFDVSRRVPRFIKGDSRRLHQILHNLVDNAVKFTHGGEVTIETRKVKQTGQNIELEFAVHDTGIGIPADQQANLFEPFVQADCSTSRSAGGTGLGLTICKYLVGQMGGRIEMESEAGKGSHFCFTAVFNASQLGERTLHPEPQRYNNLRTLIVDDHPASLTVLKNTAEALQLNVDTASNAEEALQKIRTRAQDPDSAYSLVLMDYKMPGTNGLEACLQIKTDDGIITKPKCILISSYSHDEITEEYPLVRTDGFIRKPVTPSRIFDVIALAFGESLFNEAPEQIPEEEQNRILADAHVLLAEDNIVNQKVAIAFLKKKNIQVTLANNGVEAFDLLNQHNERHFDAILMDMEMPRMDGYQATRLIREGNHDREIPIIAMTAHALQGDRELCLQAGMDDYLTKPVNPKLLYQTIAKHIVHRTTIQTRK